MSRRQDTDFCFEGEGVLQKLLTQSGSLADVEDVAGAFKKAVQEQVPAPVVIQALWEDEPRFSSPDEAAKLFGNLLGLYELIASGGTPDLRAQSTKKRAKAPRPQPFGAEGPTEGFIEGAWRYFQDHPKERQRLEHAFENRQDALVSWLDASGLDDAGFGLARHLAGEIFALFELGGRQVPPLGEAALSASETRQKTLPPAMGEWIDEILFEATSDEEEPLSQKEGKKVRELVARAAAAMWNTTA